MKSIDAQMAILMQGIDFGDEQIKRAKDILCSSTPKPNLSV